jgi:hypothetical protein
MASLIEEEIIHHRPDASAKLSTRVYGDGSIIKLSGPLLTTASNVSKRRELIDRLFSIPDLARARIHQRLGVITLRFLRRGFDPSELLEALASAMRMVTPASQSFPNQHLLSRAEFRYQFEVHRAGEKLTLWRISASNPSRLTLFHALLQRDQVRAAVIEAILSLVGVTSALARWGQGIEIGCQPGRLSKWVLLDVIESALAEALPLSRRSKKPFQLKPTLIRTNLFLAPIADYVFPPLGWASAAVTTILGITHLAPAARRWEQKKTGLDLLYACICLCTLSTFTFLPSALMYGLIEFWPKRSKKVREEGELNFLARLRRRPRNVRVEEAGKATQINAQLLKPGDVVILSAGDTVPGDGTVISGEATFSERLFSGSTAPARKTEGSSVYATTQVLEGDVRVRIAAGQTVADRLLDLYSAAFSRPDEDTHALRLAEKLVTPILLVGAAALGRGGIHMTKAVLRPDYLCGPSVVEEFGDLWVILTAAQRGIVVLDTRVLDRIFKADFWLFDDTVAWQLTGASRDTLRAFKIGADREIVFLSDSGSQQLVEREGRLRFTRLDIGGSSAAKKTFVAQRQAYGQSVAYFGDCEQESELAQQADVAVTVAKENLRVTAEAPVAFLTPDLEKFGALQSICEKRNAEIRNGFISVTLPNVAAVVAALYLTTPALFSVAMTTLGTILCYGRASRLLKEASGDSNEVPQLTE